MNCVSCKSEFIEKRDTAYLCPICGWVTCVDGIWISIPEPAKVTEPIIKKEPVADKLVLEPKANKTDSLHIEYSDRLLPCKKYLFGLVTVTEKNQNA